MIHTYEQPTSATDPTTVQWEYCFQTVKCEDLPEFMARTVNEMGRQGWEMLNIVPASRKTGAWIGYWSPGLTTMYELFFKRRLR